MNISDQEQNIIRSIARPQIDTTVVRRSLDAAQLKQADTNPGTIRSATRKKIVQVTDTTSVCSRNPVSDITFYDSTNFILNNSGLPVSGFPYVFYRERARTESVSRIRYYQSLKGGEKVPASDLQKDWLIIVILFSAFLYSLIRSGLTKSLTSFSRFFLFRGIGDPVSRETGAIFHLNSTLINLVSFINIALFLYCLSFVYGFIPDGISGFLVWLIFFGVVISAVTARHITCYLVGGASNEQEIFSEYIVTIYQSYQYSAFVMLILTVLVAYAGILPATFLLYAGILVFTVLYLIRITRLFLIFMKRSVSILYLILYLCALEFLPVVVLFKFLAGLF